MKIGIHHRGGSFSEYWIAYCVKNDIDYKLVNCNQSDIIEQLSNCDALMWHHHHREYKGALFAKELLFALKQAGKVVFPDFNSGWHFNDKVGQKYLLECIGAPMIPTYVFYNKDAALQWADKTSYPKVFKLRGGAGASNVKLIKSKRDSEKIINRAFEKGFSQFDRIENFKERFRRIKDGKDSYKHLFSAFGRLFISTEFAKNQGREKGYVYFQDFLPCNDFDIRLIVIRDKAYGMRRMNRKDDFRASGSSDFNYDKLPLNVVEIGFKVSKILNLQSVAFDFVYNEKQEPVIIELSYGFGTKGSGKCPGYWDSDLKWHADKFDPHAWMMEDILKEITNNHLTPHFTHL